jgi:hypothetical protein
MKNSTIRMKLAGVITLPLLGLALGFFGGMSFALNGYGAHTDACVQVTGICPIIEFSPQSDIFTDPPFLYVNPETNEEFLPMVDVDANLETENFFKRYLARRGKSTVSQAISND